MPVAVEIVLPCYNPSDTWHQELLLFYTEVQNRYDIRFLLVNDGSQTSRLEQQISELRQKGITLDYFSYPVNMGKGHALRTGVKETKSNCIVYTDVDFPFKNQSIVAVIDQLQSGDYDVIAGHRDQAYYQETMSGFRKILSLSFRFFLRKILRLPVTDTQCGLKGFNKLGKEVFLSTQINRYLFDFEFIYTACKNKKIRTGVVSVELKDNVSFSKMRLKVLVQESFNLLRILLFK